KGVAVLVHRNTEASILAIEGGRPGSAASQIGGVDEFGSSRVQLRHEGVSIESAIGLEGIDDRKVDGSRLPDDVGVPASIDGNAGATVAVLAIEVSRVDERVTGGIKLGHESVCTQVPSANAPPGIRLQHAGRGRKVVRFSLPGDIGVPVRVHR